MAAPSPLPEHKPLERVGKPNVISQPQVNFPTKKLRLRSLLWVKPTGVAVTSASSFLAQFFPVLILNLATISTGLGFGFAAVALPQLRFGDPNASDEHHAFGIDEDDESWIVGSFGLGAAVSGLSSALIANYFGRRRCLLLMTVPDLLGWALIVASGNIWMLVAGRFFTGFSAIGYLHSVLIYTAEISQPQHRGVLTAVTVPSMALGTLVAYCLGTVAAWYHVAIVGCAIPLVLIPGLLMLSNSPYWYLQQGEDKLAIQAMEKFRSRDANALSELLAIADIFNVASGLRNPMEEDTRWTSRVFVALQKITGRKNRKPMLILSALFVFSLLSGHFAISFHLVEILQEAYEGGSLKSGFFAAIVVGAIKFVASVMFVPAVKFFKRRFLLVASSIMMAAALCILGLSMRFHDLGTATVPGWIPLAAATLYMAAYSMGLGSLPLVYTAEFFPASTRSLLSGIAISLAQVEMVAVVMTFPVISEGVYWSYAGICLAAAIFALMFVPETKGKSLEEIEKNFAFKDSLHVSPYNTPMPQRRISPKQSVQFTL